MIEMFLAIFIIIHVALWVLGVLFRVPGFVVVAIILDFLTMGASVILIQKPVVLPSSNSTATFAIEGIRDPFTAFAQFILLVIYLFTLFEMFDEFSREEEPKKKEVVWLPLEMLRR